MSHRYIDLVPNLNSDIELIDSEIEKFDYHRHYIPESVQRLKRNLCHLSQWINLDHIHDKIAHDPDHLICKSGSRVTSFFEQSDTDYDGKIDRLYIRKNLFICRSAINTSPESLEVICDNIQSSYKLGLSLYNLIFLESIRHLELIDRILLRLMRSMDIKDIPGFDLPMSESTDSHPKTVHLDKGLFLLEKVRPYIYTHKPTKDPIPEALHLLKDYAEEIGSSWYPKQYEEIVEPADLVASACLTLVRDLSDKNNLLEVTDRQASLLRKYEIALDYFRMWPNSVARLSRILTDCSGLIPSMENLDLASAAKILRSIEPPIRSMEANRYIHAEG